MRTAEPIEVNGSHIENGGGLFTSKYPLATQRWGIEQKLAQLGIGNELLEQTYTLANLSMEHFRRDEYDRKPEVIAARKFFYSELLELDDVKLRSLQRIRAYWPRPEVSFSSLENFENHGYDSQRMVALEPMTLTRFIDISATEAVFKKNGFSGTNARRTLNSNPKAFHFKPQSLDQKLKYIKSLGLPPQVIVLKYPRILNNRPHKLGANAAFFDAMTTKTDDIVISTPSLLSMSDTGRGEIMRIREFCEEHDIDPDNALKNIGGISFKRVVTTHEMLADAGLDADRMLASRFTLVNYSQPTLQKKMARLDRYLRYAGFDEYERIEFMQRNPQGFTASDSRMRYLARAINAIVNTIPNIDRNVTNITNIGIAVSKAGPELVVDSLSGERKYESLKEYIDSLRRSNRERLKSNGRNKKARNYGAYALKLKGVDAAHRTKS